MNVVTYLIKTAISMSVESGPTVWRHILLTEKVLIVVILSPSMTVFTSENLK